MFQKERPYSNYIVNAIKKIKDLIDQNPFQYKTAAELRGCITIPHRATVEKAFKEVYGAGIKEYQVKTRLEASKRFLEEGMSKKEVAAKCFYTSQSSFAAAFKKEFKMTPTQWQLSYAI
ncbi:helix-turn-helix domain-containing protein [Niastella sp. OAS944]|uniref:helix-turn-helix domain-containing protein n=1 Tax=Niastella sp. OAS944 TaxID=2664089 RepID=UPI00346A4CD2|nr:AraC-like DNA-binding protein [Chitinophagaceae bacterium OAS944]